MNIHLVRNSVNAIFPSPKNRIMRGPGVVLFPSAVCLFVHIHSTFLYILYRVFLYLLIPNKILFSAPYMLSLSLEYNESIKILRGLYAKRNSYN